MQSLIAEWSGEAVVTAFDAPTETWIFIALHNTSLGPAMGGCRMMVYPSPRDGLRDAMRLAEGMTYKWAAIDFELGGGKSVLAVPRPLAGPERERVLRRLGRLIESLRGAYATGPDLGTTPSDMALLRQETRYVHGVGANGRSTIDPGPFTALGVVVGMQAALRHVLGSDDLRGRAVLIQGVGDVGRPLARQLRAAGAEVLLSDVNARAAEQLAAELGGSVVRSDAVYTTPCDVYAPCAVGATLNRDTIEQLRCRIVAGSANNQLADPDDADRLRQRGILYAPDYVINAGGATALPLLGRGDHTEEQIRQRIRGFDRALTEIFTEADARGESPLHAAARRVERVLARKAKR